MTAETTQSISQTPRRGKRRWAFRAAAMFVGLIAAFALAECAVRMMGETDDDGNFVYEGRFIGGINPPVHWVREKLEPYQADEARMIFDPQTGWSPRPGGVSHNGMYRYESHGIRTAGPDVARQPAEGVLRIAIFGDSFAHGDDVPFEQSWGRLLEERLKAEGVNAEVVNFGVSAYGMDQAFLRWRTLGKAFRPDVVLFGFQAENVNRNVNLLRGFYVAHTGIPLSKPRFVLNDAGRLQTVNQPTLPMERIPEVMADMSSWEPSRHEWFYNPQDFDRRFWQPSRFLALLVDRLRDSEQPGVSRPGPTLRPDGEPAQVTLQILREFREEVEETGGTFHVVHLPKHADLQRLRSGRGLAYAGLWKLVEREQNTIDPLPELMDAAKADGPKPLFAAPKHAHYSESAGRILAAKIAPAVQRAEKTGR